jgi:hypothetical protein
MTNTKRGRPAFEPTDEQRSQVEIWAIAMTHDEIATALGISAPTLAKHFRDELAGGPARRRAALIESLYGAGMMGNVSAIRTLEQLRAAMPVDDPTEAIEQPEPTGKKARAAVNVARLSEPGSRFAVRPAPPGMGKKERALLDAETAGQGTDWGDDLNIPLTKPN